MQYPNVVAAAFLNRPNRFVAEAKIGEQSVICHVKNTGRCRELLIPGATVYLQDFGETMRARKTRYDLIAVEKRTGICTSVRYSSTWLVSCSSMM